VFYGWWLSGVAALVMVLGTVPFFQGMPAWNVALENHFHWSRGQLALAFSLSRVEGSIMGPVGGYLTDKLGPRRMVLVGLLVLGGGFLLFSQVRQLWQFYLAFVVMSMGAGLGTWLPMMTALNNWFIQRRSIAMAIANAQRSRFLPAAGWLGGGVIHGCGRFVHHGWRLLWRPAAP
jgi:MFS family permease